MKCVIDEIEKVIYEHAKVHQDVHLISLDGLYYSELVRHANAVNLEAQNPIKDIFEFCSSHASYSIKIIHYPFQEKAIITYAETKVKIDVVDAKS